MQSVNQKKSIFYLLFLLILILITFLIAVSIYSCLIKYKLKKIYKHFTAHVPNKIFVLTYYKNRE